MAQHDLASESSDISYQPIQVTSTKDRELYFLSWAIFGGFLVTSADKVRQGKEYHPHEPGTLLLKTDPAPAHSAASHRNHAQPARKSCHQPEVNCSTSPLPSAYRFVSIWELSDNDALGSSRVPPMVLSTQPMPLSSDSCSNSSEHSWQALSDRISSSDIQNIWFT